MKNQLSFLLIPVLLLFGGIAFAQEYGTASYYSDDFQGMETAYGDLYDKAKFTAAHRRHPKGTKLKVTRLDNKKSVIVTVNDKGPWIKGRIVDLSRAAADQIDLIEEGVADVMVEVYTGTETAQNANASKTSPSPTNEAKATAAKKVAANNTPKSYDIVAPTTKKEATPKAVKTNTTTTTTSDKNKKVNVGKDGNAKVVRDSYSGTGLYKIVLMKPEKKGFGVQVGAYNTYESVLQEVAKLQGKWFDNILIYSGIAASGKKMYKVILGPFESMAAANNYKKSIGSKHKIKGFVINIAELK